MTSTGYTPLHLAAREGHRDMAAALLDQGASLGITTKVSTFMYSSTHSCVVLYCKSMARGSSSSVHSASAMYSYNMRSYLDMTQTHEGRAVKAERLPVEEFGHNICWHECSAWVWSQLLWESYCMSSSVSVCLCAHLNSIRAFYYHKVWGKYRTLNIVWFSL